MNNIIELIQQIISLLIACLIIKKYAIPVLKKTMEDRYINLIKSKLLLEANLKKSRKSYEDANLKYIHALGYKEKWIELAEAQLQEKLVDIYAKHHETLSKINEDYHQQLEQLQKNKKLSYLDDILYVVAHELKVQKIDYKKLLQKMN